MYESGWLCDYDLEVVARYGGTRNPSPWSNLFVSCDDERSHTASFRSDFGGSSLPQRVNTRIASFYQLGYIHLREFGILVLENNFVVSVLVRCAASSESR